MYFAAAAAGAGAWLAVEDCACEAEVASVVAAVVACWTACWAAWFTVPSGRAGSPFPLNEARTNEGWVSSLGNMKRGAEICEFLEERSTDSRGVASVYRNSGRDSLFCEVSVVAFAGVTAGSAGCALK